MNSQPHPDPHRVSRFALGQIDPHDVELLEQHVAECEDCCRVMAAVDDDQLIRLAREAVAKVGAIGDTQVDVGDSIADAPASTTDIHDLHSPAELDDHERYRVIEPLGCGGMGVVFKAEHRLMKRVVALKVINQRYTNDSQAVARFRQEVEAAASLSHPNIVTAFDAEQAGQVHFLVMEYVEGQSLDQVVEQHGALPIDEACEFIRQAASGLQHAHQRGMIHRDIKPQNLMLTNDSIVKVLDFGLARLASELGPSVAGITREKTLLGSPDFISPEQAEDSRSVDARSDVYSLGCTLYYLLTGRVPFPIESSILKLSSHVLVEPKPVTSLRTGLPPGLSSIVNKMMAKSADDRYQRVDEVISALKPFANVHSPPVTESSVGTPQTNPKPILQRTERRRRPAIIAAVILIFAAFLLSVVMAFWPPGNQSSPANDDDVFVLFLLAPDQLWYEDFGPVYDKLKQNGVQVSVASTREVISVNPDSHPTVREVKADLLLEDVNVSYYDIIVFAGGDVGPFCGDGEAADKVASLIHEHLNNQMFVAAICHGQRVLLSAGVLNEIEAAKPALFETWHGQEKVAWVNGPFVMSGHILTASDPEYAELFAQELLKLLGRQ